MTVADRGLVMVFTSNAKKSVKYLHHFKDLTMLVYMFKSNNPEIALLSKAITEPEVGRTESFRWHATAIGIAALWIKKSSPSKPPFDKALKEGLNIGLDLSREEKYCHYISEGIIILFQS